VKGIEMSKFVTEPECALVGKPVIEIAGVMRFLEDHGYAWPELEEKLGSMMSLGDDDCEWLVEMAGRNCYQSWPNVGETKKKGRSHEDHVKHLIEIGHGCYDGETEVLTIDGWKKFSEATAEDLFATRTRDGILQYCQSKNYTAYHHDGKMYKVHGKGLDLLVTPNHNMLVCKTTTQTGRKRQMFGFIKAEDLDTISHCYVKTADWSHNPDSEFAELASLDVYKLLGFTIGDGSIQPNSKQIRFRLRKQRKIDFLINLIKSIGWEQPTIGFLDSDRFVLNIPDWAVSTFKDVYNGDREKVVPRDLLVSSSKEQLIALYEGLIESDGHKSKNGQVNFDTTSIQLADQFQQLCLHIGIAANIACVYNEDQRQASFGDKALIRLSAITRELKPEVNKYEGCVGKTEWINDWSGMVYCVEVPNNTLYVRRNGKPVWCGNSCIEHANFNFIIWNVSRSLTHELVRHRLASYSQLSQRYVDSSNVDFIVPPAIQELAKKDPETYRAWIEHCERSRQLYEDLTVKLSSMYEDTESKLEKRKKARQAARSVLPNATETKIFVTMNARAIRHLVELRANPAADVEIRLLAVKICRILLDKAPLLAHGLGVIQLPDGTEGVESSHRRV
jgi:thymidylate synthase (FAD)